MNGAAVALTQAVKIALQSALSTIANSQRPGVAAGGFRALLNLVDLMTTPTGTPKVPTASAKDGLGPSGLANTPAALPQLGDASTDAMKAAAPGGSNVPVLAAPVTQPLPALGADQSNSFGVNTTSNIVTTAANSSANTTSKLEVPGYSPLIPIREMAPSSSSAPTIISASSVSTPAESTLVAEKPGAPSTTTATMLIEAAKGNLSIRDHSAIPGTAEEFAAQATNSPKSVDLVTTKEVSTVGPVSQNSPVQPSAAANNGCTASEPASLTARTTASNVQPVPAIRIATDSIIDSMAGNLLPIGQDPAAEGFAASTKPSSEAAPAGAPDTQIAHGNSQPPVAPSPQLAPVSVRGKESNAVNGVSLPEAGSTDAASVQSPTKVTQGLGELPSSVVFGTSLPGQDLPDNGFRALTNLSDLKTASSTSPDALNNSVKKSSSSHRPAISSRIATKQTAQSNEFASTQKFGVMTAVPEAGPVTQSAAQTVPSAPVQIPTRTWEQQDSTNQPIATAVSSKMPTQTPAGSYAGDKSSAVLEVPLASQDAPTDNLSVLKNAASLSNFPSNASRSMDDPTRSTSSSAERSTTADVTELHAGRPRETGVAPSFASIEPTAQASVTVQPPPAGNVANGMSARMVQDFNSGTLQQTDAMSTRATSNAGQPDASQFTRYSAAPGPDAQILSAAAKQVITPTSPSTTEKSLNGPMPGLGPRSYKSVANSESTPIETNLKRPSLPMQPRVVFEKRYTEANSELMQPARGRSVAADSTPLATKPSQRIEPSLAGSSSNSPALPVKQDQMGLEAKPEAVSAPAKTVNQSPTRATTGVEITPMNDGEEQSATLFPAESATTPTANEPVLSPMTPDLQNFLNSPVETSRTYAELLMGSNLGKSSTELSTSHTQTTSKPGLAEKKTRTQEKSGTEFDLSTSTQTSVRDSSEVKQAAAAGNIANSLGQNSQSPHVPVPEAAGPNTLRDTLNGHTTAQDKPADVHAREASEFAAPEVHRASPLGSVQTASLVQHLSESELRVGIQSGEFGKIDIHTSINQNQISARIYVEHEELGRAMAGNLPQLHEKLSAEHRIDAQIELHNSGTGHSNGSERQQQQQRTPEQHRPASRDADEPTLQAETMRGIPSTAASMTMGLDMHV